MSYTSVKRIERITTCDVGTMIMVREEAYSYRGLLLPRGPIEHSFLAAWAQHGPGKYTLQFNREWGCVGATPVARSTS